MNIPRIKVQASKCEAAVDSVVKEISGLNRIPRQASQVDIAYYNRTNVQSARRASDKISLLILELEHMQRLLTE